MKGKRGLDGRLSFLPALLPSTWPGQGETGVILEQSRGAKQALTGGFILEEALLFLLSLGRRLRVGRGATETL